MPAHRPAFDTHEPALPPEVCRPGLQEDPSPDPVLGFDLDELPILPDTAAELEVLAHIEHRHGNVDARTLAKVIVNDPLMTLRLFRQASGLRRAGQVTEADTITAAVLQTGIHRFFERHAHAPAMTRDRLEQAPWQERFERLLTQSRRSASLVGALALHRQDHEAESLQEAALLQESRRLLACALGRNEDSQPWVPERERLDPLESLQQRMLTHLNVPDRLRRLSDPAHPDARLFAPQQTLLSLCRQLSWITADDWPTLEISRLETPAFDGMPVLEEDLIRSSQDPLEPDRTADARSDLYHRHLLPGIARLVHLSPVSADRILREFDR